MADTITGVFTDEVTAERAISELDASGFSARPSGAARGNVLLAVDAQGRADEVRRILLRAGASAIATDGALGNIGGLAPSAVTDAPPARDVEPGAIGGLAPASVTDAAPAAQQTAPDPATVGTIGGLAPDAVTNAPPEPNVDERSERSIGGLAPDAVTNAPPDGGSQATAPADNTIVTPGMETPYKERHAQSGDAPERHPITDADIIAEGERRRAHDHPADLDVPPTSEDQGISPRPDQ
jgi:hypothetical protein